MKNLLKLVVLFSISTLYSSLMLGSYVEREFSGSKNEPRIAIGSHKHKKSEERRKERKHHKKHKKGHELKIGSHRK